MYSVCVYAVLCSRKERLCNGCFIEDQRDLMMTSDTETDSELGTSPERDTSPLSDNTLVEPADTITTDDDSPLLTSASDAAASNADEDEIMSRSAPAAYDSATWTMRGTAYSAMSWVTGVVSRSFVRPTDGRPADDDNTDVNAAAAANVAAETLDVNSEETASSFVADTQTEDANSTLTDTFSADVAVPGVGNSLSPSQSAATLTDSVEAVSTRADTRDSVTQPSLSCDSTAGEICQSLQPGDTVQRYCISMFSMSMFCYLCGMVMHSL